MIILLSNISKILWENLTHKIMISMIIKIMEDTYVNNILRNCIRCKFLLNASKKEYLFPVSL